MSVASRMAVAEVPVAKVFGPGVPPQIQAAEERAQMTPASPFSPGEPIGPYDGFSRTPRSHEFVTSVNTSARPRSHERVSFETLKGLIRSYDVAQLCIRHRIASLRSLDWKLIAADAHDGDVAAAIEVGMAALKRPDRKTLFKPWLAKYLRGILSFDAGTLHRMRNRGGRVVGLKVVDGTTIAPLMDYWGDSPESPAPAYVQYVNGLPWDWLTRDDLIYEPYDPQDDSIYGRAPLEDILLNANTDIRFQLYFLQRFTEGNLPHAFASAPEGWTPQQIEQFQEYWDGFMLGDQSRKHQIRWVPGGSSFAWSDEKEFTDHFSLFLMRKTCAAYSVVPSDLGFTESVNRSSGESQADVQHRVGDLPLAHHVMDILSAFLQDDLGLPLKFIFDLGEEQDDRVDQAQADKIYVDMGAISPSDIREMRYGLAEPGGVPVPRFIFTERSGPIPLSSLMAVAGEVDPATAAPAPGAELPREVFGGTEGVAPSPPIKVAPLAEQEFGPSAMPAAPPPQPQAPGEPVAKEGETAPAAGITAETGLYGYDLVRALDDDEDSDPASVAKEMSAFRRYSKARRKGGEWRDFEFRAIGAGQARELNAEGRESVRKASGYDLSPRSGMISLDLPEGLIDPVPGGVDDHHVTVVYLGPDVDDEAFAAACDRAAQAAASAPGPLSGTVSGVGAFPPSGSSDGKVPAWAAVAVPGAEALREALADLSASEHKDWAPHVTLAYLDPGEPLPAPIEPVPVTFTHLSVHRGDDVRRFPLGGDPPAAPESPSGDGPDEAADTAAAVEKRRAELAGIDRLMRTPPAPGRPSRARHRTGSDDHLEMGVAKAGDGKGPKGWPGWKLDLRTAGYWQPQVTASAQQSLTSDRLNGIAAGYITDHPDQDGTATGKRDRNAAALAWLQSRGITVPMTSVAEGITTDAAMIGGTSAQAAVNGQDDADTGDWEPGDSGTARRVTEAMGVAAVLTLLPGGDDSGSGGGIAGDIAGDMEDGYLNVVARVLAGWDPEVAADELGGMLADAVADGAYAEGLTVTQITTIAGQAAGEYYLANTKSPLQWVAVIDSRTCPACLANAAADPRRYGDEWPSGHVSPPAHPGGCRCALVPDWA